MNKLTRTCSLSLLLLIPTSSGPCRVQKEGLTERRIENPADCRCRFVEGRTVCNSACESDIPPVPVK